jgi:hypothetical protein
MTTRVSIILTIGDIDIAGRRSPRKARQKTKRQTRKESTKETNSARRRRTRRNRMRKPQRKPSHPNQVRGAHGSLGTMDVGCGRLVRNPKVKDSSAGS